eukprot:4497367-Heterocapsa_arctica.AAC.1
MAAGVVRDVAWPRRSMAILSPRLCSQSVLMSQAAAHCSRMDCWAGNELLQMLGSAAGVEGFQARDVPGDLPEPARKNGVLSHQHAVVFADDQEGLSDNAEAVLEVRAARACKRPKGRLAGLLAGACDGASRGARRLWLAWVWGPFAGGAVGAAERPWK